MRIFCAIYRPWLAAIVAGSILLCSPAGWASNASSTDDGAPVFTRQQDEIVATLIPRAKSTSVRIAFEATGGSLADVTAKPFEEAASSGADEKDFKSGVFIIQVTDVPVGGKATLSITSDFFSSSTQFWIFNAHQAEPWTQAGIENKSHPNLVQELILTVVDGGPQDADHVANGRITVVGGPWDSFWGYALGTLFIRFFGIFLVLSVLMIGMMLSGKVFETLERRRDSTGRGTSPDASGPVAPAESIPPSTGAAPPPDTQKIAAMSLALHMHLNRLRAQTVTRLDAPIAAAWVQQGRQRAMGPGCLSIRNRKP